MQFINELWDFIKSNVQILVNGAYLIMAIILLARKKKLSKSEILTGLEPIMEQLPEWIKDAEECLGQKTGLTKLVYVLQKCMMECDKKGIEYNEKFWKEKIEKILDTPEKKEK